MSLFKFEPKHIKVLPTFHGVAEDMGELFTPSDCLDCVCVRYGMIKHARFGKAWCVMIASKMDGSLNIVVMWKPDEFSKDPWTTEKQFCSHSFKQFAKEHIIKN